MTRSTSSFVRRSLATHGSARQIEANARVVIFTGEKLQSFRENVERAESRWMLGSYKARQFFGQGGGEAHFFSGFGMWEAQETGVQAEAFGGIGFGFVFFVADDGVAEVCELNADLMAASGFEREFDERARGFAGEDAVVRDGVAREFRRWRTEYFEWIRFVEIGFHGPAVLGQATFNDGLVAFLGFVPAGLQRFLRLRGLGKNHQPGSFTVETMDDPDAFTGFLLALTEVVGELKIRGFFLLRLARDAEEIIGFVDDDDVGVFVVNGDSAGEHRAWRCKAIRANGDDIAGVKRMVELCDGAVIHHD